jgi:hypothetical protein
MQAVNDDNRPRRMNMTKESKQRVLDAFDALIQVENGAPVPVGGRHNSHGGSARCDVCGHSLAEGTPHEQQLVKLTTYYGEPTPGYCPIGVAVAALSRLVPPYEKRDEWLAADERDLPKPSEQLKL